jgi:CrcB protein
MRWELMCATPARKAGFLHRDRTAFKGRVLMAAYLWIAVGSALGGMARFWCSGLAARLIGETFPWGTLLVNVVGSFIIGFFATLTGPDSRVFVDTLTRQFVILGICGGYTTFSSFSLQTLSLVQDGEWWLAGANIALSLIACLIAVWAGYALAASINALKWI